MWPPGPPVQNNSGGFFLPSKVYRDWLNSLISPRSPPGHYLCGRCFMARDPINFPPVHPEKQCPIRQATTALGRCWWCYGDHAGPKGYECEWAPKRRQRARLFFKKGCRRCGLDCSTARCKTDTFIPEVLATLRARSDWVKSLSSLWNLDIKTNEQFYTACFADSLRLKAALIRLVIPEAQFRDLTANQGSQLP